jgi:Na+-driven multidrug efflux pump
MWIVLTAVNSMATASGINISIRLGKLNAAGAKQAGHVGAYMSLVFLLLVFGLVVRNIRALGRIFTNDASFLDSFEETKWPFSITLLLMNLSVAIEKIPYSMGRTAIVFWMGCIASWGAQVPAVLFLTTYWRNDLMGLYSGMAIGYFVLVVLYSAIAFTSDWHKYARLAYDRSESTENNTTS